MPVLDDARRWLVDRAQKNDEAITITPKESLRGVDQKLLHMSAPERERTINHLKAYADLYYVGRHNEPVPAEVQASLKNLETQSAKLKIVDQAKVVLAQYGGPPTKETVQQAVSRSVAQAATIQASPAHSEAIQQAPSVPTKTVQKQQSVDAPQASWQTLLERNLDTAKAPTSALQAHLNELKTEWNRIGSTPDGRAVRREMMEHINGYSDAIGNRQESRPVDPVFRAQALHTEQSLKAGTLTPEAAAIHAQANPKGMIDRSYNVGVEGPTGFNLGAETRQGSVSASAQHEVFPVAPSAVPVIRAHSFKQEKQMDQGYGMGL